MEEKVLSDKFIRKYMRLAKQVGEDLNPCMSRHIGVIIVNPVQNRILGTGYNGPPKNTPHPDEPVYLREVVWPQLTSTELELLATKSITDVEQFVSQYGNKRICPRKIIGAASGCRLELCSCEHAEKNAIVNACQDVHGSWMLCWCGIPCWDCSKLIINSGIIQLVCIDWGKDYSLMSRWLLEKKGIRIQMRNPETLDTVV